jgi:molybdate/tungstate transport system permease protein
MTRKRKSPDAITVLFSIMGALLLAFIALPLVMTVLSEDPLSIASALADPEVQSAIAVSFGGALIATAISCLFGIPLGYVMARTRFPGKGIIQGIIDLPVVIPHTIAGVALLVVFGRMGLFSSEMDALNLRFEDEFLGIIAAMMFVSASFIVNASRDGFEAVDERLESVARSLGASRLEAIFTVTIPLSLPSIVTGIVLSWARAVSEFGAVVIIAYFPKIVPTLIYEKTLRSGLSEAMPVAALLILICVGVFVLLRTFTAIWKRRMEGME